MATTVTEEELMAINTTDGAYGFNTISSDSLNNINEPEPFNYKWLYVGLQLLGIPGNVFAILVITSSAVLRSKNFNILIVHQSFVDALVFITDVTPRLLPEVRHTSVISEVICRISTSRSLRTSIIHVAHYNLSAMALERYWAVTKPFTHDEVKVRRRLPFIFITVWILGLLSMTPKFVTSRMMAGMYREYAEIVGHPLYPIIIPYFFLVSCILPAGVMVYSYMRISMTIRRSNQFQQQATHAGLSEALASTHQHQMDMIHTLLILVVVFVVVWMIYGVFFILYYFSVLTDISQIGLNISYLIVFSNSLINPYVYCLRYKKFKDRALMLLKIKSK